MTTNYNTEKLAGRVEKVGKKTYAIVWDNGNSNTLFMVGTSGKIYGALTVGCKRAVRAAMAVAS